MRPRDGALLLALFSSGLTGCATSAIDSAPERPDRPWKPATTGFGEILPGKPGEQPAYGGYVLPANGVAATLPFAPSELNAEHAYSLSELVDIAQSNNPLTRTAWNNARVAALASGVVRSAYLPNVTGSFVAGYRNGDSSISGLGPDADNHVTSHGTITALSLLWLLFDFGERDAVLEASREDGAIASIAFTGAHQHVIHAVCLAFYAHAALRARVVSTEKSLQNVEVIRSAAEDRYAQGVGTVIEAAQARQAAAQARLLHVKAVGAAEDAYVTLIAATGISPLTRIGVADVSGRTLPSADDHVARVVEAALARRPDVLEAYAARKAGLARIRAAQAESLPKLVFAATGSYATGSFDLGVIPVLGHAPALNVSGNRLGITLLGGVSMPVFDGGRRLALLAQARAQADTAEARLARVKNEAIREVIFAENTLRTTLAAHDASRELVAAAQTTYDATLEAFKTGVGSVTEVMLAQDHLLLAHDAETDAYYASLSAAATLALSTGVLGAAP